MKSIDIEEISKTIAINEKKLMGISKVVEEEIDELEFDEMFSREGEVDNFDEVAKSGDNEWSLSDADRIYSELVTNKVIICPSCGYKFKE